MRPPKRHCRPPARDTPRQSASKKPRKGFQNFKQFDKCCCGPDALLCEVTSRAVCVDGALGAELLLVLASLHLSGADAFTFLGFLEADFHGIFLIIM
jgi:hypothetical protein